MFIFWLFAEYQALIFSDANITNLGKYNELHSVSCQFGPYGDFNDENEKEEVWRCQTILSDKYIISYSKIRYTDIFYSDEWKHNFSWKFMYSLKLNQTYLRSLNQSRPSAIDSHEIYFVTNYDEMYLQIAQADMSIFLFIIIIFIIIII